MEGLAPPLELLLCVKQAVEQGFSVKKGMQDYVNAGNKEFHITVLQFLSLLEQGKSVQEMLGAQKSIYRQSLLTLLLKSFQGFPIYQSLCELETEIVVACDDEIQHKIAKLPFLTMIPLLLFMFPSFLLLLFGPLLNNLFHSFGGG